MGLHVAGEIQSLMKRYFLWSFNLNLRVGLRMLLQIKEYLSSVDARSDI